MGLISSARIKALGQKTAIGLLLDLVTPERREVMLLRQRGFPPRVVHDAYSVASTRLGHSRAAAEMMHSLLGQLEQTDTERQVDLRRVLRTLGITRNILGTVVKDSVSG